MKNTIENFHKTWLSSESPEIAEAKKARKQDNQAQNMRLFRILTEDKNRQDIEKLVGIAFDGFTIYSASGYWKGQSESSLVIELYAPDLDAGLVRSTAEAIKLANAQEAVLVLELEVRGEMV